MEKFKLICGTISSITTALIIGEVFGGCVSRPIAAWRSSINMKNFSLLYCAMNERICALEDKEHDQT